MWSLSNLSKYNIVISLQESGGKEINFAHGKSRRSIDTGVEINTVDRSDHIAVMEC
jgi:hypothetical protein